jgi:hypothetical protein
MKLGLRHGLPALLLVACSSSSAGSSSNDGGLEGAASESGPDVGSGQDAASGEDASGQDASGDAASEAAATCNTLANAATPVTEMQVAMAPPMLQGGTIADGTYFLTGFTIYTGPQGATGAMGTRQTTLQIMGSTIQVADSVSPMTRTVTLTTSGIAFTGKTTCPSGLGDILGAYTATSTSFVVQLGGGGDAGAPTTQETFTKQ